MIERKQRRLGIIAAMLCCGAWMGCGDEAGIQGGPRDGANGGATFGSAPVGDGSLEGDLIDEAELDAYIERTARELDAAPTIIAPWTRQVPRARARASSLTPDTLTMPNLVPGRADYRVGDVLVSDDIEGERVFLRRVTSVEIRGDVTLYGTANAAVTDVVFKGELTQTATEPTPSQAHLEQGNNPLVMALRQGLSVTDFFPNLQRIADVLLSGPWKFKVGGRDVSVLLELYRQIRFDNSGSHIDFDAKINRQGLLRAIGLDTSERIAVALNHDLHPSRTLKRQWGNQQQDIPAQLHGRITDGYQMRTSCSSVVRALEVIERTPDCKDFYENWISSGFAPNVLLPEEVTDFYGGSYYPHVQLRLHRNVYVEAPSINLGNENLYQPVCESPRGTHLMPFVEQTTWAQQHCQAGALESFDFDARFAPQLDVEKFGLEVELSSAITGEGSRDIVEPFELGEELPLGERKTYQRFFIGWLPVVTSFKTQIVTTPLSISGGGTAKVYVDQPFSGNLDWSASYHYREQADAQYAAGSHADANFSSSFDFFSLEDVTIEGNGTLSVASSPLGLKVEMLVYETGGLVLDGPKTYVQADFNTGGAIRANGMIEDADVCPIGIHAGLRAQVLMKGQIPFTSRAVDAPLTPTMDTCGDALNRNKQSFYHEEVPTFAGVPLCFKHCFDSIPLQVYITWDQEVDVDLFVTDPSGREASYSTDNSIPNAQHSSRCGQPGRCTLEPMFESVTWSVAPDTSGTYRVKLHNRGDQSATVTGYARAQRQDGTSYIDQPISITLGAGQENEDFTFEFTPQR